MPSVTSTRRLLAVTAAGGVVFGASMAAFVSTQGGGLSAWGVVLTGLGAAIVFGGSMFLVFFFGFVRPRQLDPGPPGFIDRQQSASERMWGDGRSLPAWLRRSMYAAVLFCVVMALLNVGLMVASGATSLGQVGGAVMFVGLAVLTFMVARRGAHARPPHSTWEVDQH